MLDNETKRRIDTARDILVGKVPDPKSQVEQITIALIYKFMDDMDREAIEFGGEAAFFTGSFKKYSWTSIFNPKLGGHEMLNLYSEGISKLPLHHSKDFPKLFRDIFKNTYLPYRDAETLKMFLKIINEFKYDHSERLGDAFEYLLSVLSSQGDAGQFRTPRHIIDFMVAVLQPKKNETICDPACGTAGFLISSYKYIVNQNPSVGTRDRVSSKDGVSKHLTPAERKKMMNNFVGYDISPDMVRLSLVNMYLHNFITPQIHEYDTLASEDRWGEYFDIIMANPPFMSPKGGIKPHKKFTMQANRSEVLFVDYIAEHINPTTGRAGVIVPEGIIFQSATAYKSLRKLLVDKNYLYAVVSLPAGIFQPYSGVKTSILFMDRLLAKKTDKILFVKIENDGFDLGAQRRAIDKNDLTGGLISLQQYKDSLINNSEFVSENKNVFVVEKEKIAANGDYNLSVDRYRVDENVKHSKWEMVRLGDVAEINAGNSAPQGKDYFENGITPFFRTSDVGEVHISSNLLSSRDKVNEKAIKEFGLKPFPSKTILFPKSGASVFLNHRVMIGTDGYVSSHLATINSNRKKLSQEFLFYLLCEIDAKKLTEDQDYPSLRLSDISNIEIPLPPLSIQQQIVGKIENYQRIIDGAKQVVENYKPQIDIDPEWEMVELGKVLVFVGSGVTPLGGKNIYKSKGILFIRSQNVLWGVSDFSDAVFIDEKTHQEMKRSQLRKNDVLLNITGASIGRSSVFNEEFDANVNQHVTILRTNENILPVFLMHCLLSKKVQDQIWGIQSGGTRQALNYQQIKILEIPLPSLQTQQQIIDRIEQEQQLVNANKELIKIYEQKIKDEINKLWVRE